ncbi:MAG TPA: hypothetical protein VFQ63_01385 [Patescibacteria group bacterium]|nr:hypothetical protein [Patescibacteria group bacterium]
MGADRITEHLGGKWTVYRPGGTVEKEHALSSERISNIILPGNIFETFALQMNRFASEDARSVILLYGQQHKAKAKVMLGILIEPDMHGDDFNGFVRDLALQGSDIDVGEVNLEGMEMLGMGVVGPSREDAEEALKDGTIGLVVLGLYTGTTRRGNKDVKNFALTPLGKDGRGEIYEIPQISTE